MTGGGPASSTKVLVVEDNPGDARLVELFLLEDAASPVQVFKSALLSQALEILSADSIDVVLLDLSLPDSFGLETLSRLRAASPHIPVVVLTGTNDGALALESLRQGAQDYLVKGQGDGELLRRSIHYAIERSHAAAALRRSEARFRALFANAGIGVVLADADGCMVEANPAFLSMVGYSLEELHGKTFRGITHPDDVGLNDGLRASILAGESESFELTKRYVSKDGRVVWAKLTSTVMREDDCGVPYTVTVVEDVTERKRLEDNMRLAATVFENSGDGLFVSDAENRIVHVNPAFTDITGYQPEDVIGKNPRVLASGRHDKEFFEKFWGELLETGKWQGEIWDRRKDGEMFAGWQSIAAVFGDDGAVQNYVAVISDITSRKQVEEKLSYAANHDPLTKLPNRTLFNERLSRAIARAQRSKTMVALMFIDLDKFKQVNDTMGHLAGDMLLQQVSERLSLCIRQGDTAARLSGDEFCVILEDVQDPRDAAVVAHKLLRRLVEPIRLSQGDAHISASIGVAMYPDDADGAEALLNKADSAMYRAKNEGRNACRFHSDALNAKAFERMALEAVLQHAVELGQLFLEYQPIFDVASGRVGAVEALVRWNHPDLGVIEPQQFLPAAEESGLIGPICRWILTNSCRQAAEWRRAGADNLRLHVNISGRQLRRPDLMDNIASALDLAGLPPSALVLEIPESALVDNSHDPSEFFTRLTALGIGMAAEEFGAGYSSFMFLRGLPLTSLKISQAFVRSLSGGDDDSEIVTAIVALARGLHMSVAAAGIETETQLNTLIKFGCDRVQGFLLSHPLAAADMGEMLDRQQRGDAAAPWSQA